jgi:hypothetical protein
MALPTYSQLKGMDWAFQGQPFVEVPVPGKNISLMTLDYAYQGQPFVRNDQLTVYTTNVVWPWPWSVLG